MDLYRISGRKLNALENEPFLLEKDIQSVVEENLEALFNLTFVSTEFAIGEFRLDTLCFEEETNAFVIIEYKLKRNYSVIDQGYSYLSAMLNNKAEFILEFNEKSDRTLKRNDVDWASSRVIFISPAFNNFQKNSVNFKDIPFELWQIQRSKGGLIGLEQHQASSRESIETISGREQKSLISKVSSEVRVVTEEDHIAKASDNCQKIWVEFRDRLANFSGTHFFSTKSYVGMKKGTKNLCVIGFRKNSLNIEVVRGTIRPSGKRSKEFFSFDDPKKVAKDKTWKWKSGDTGVVYVLKVDAVNDLDYVMYLINQKYEKI